MDEERFAELVERVRRDGVVQPVVVRGVGAGYELIAGERRWRAAQAAGLTTMPALVREADDRTSLLLALVENVVREDLNAVERPAATRACWTSSGSRPRTSRPRSAAAARPSPTRCACSSCPTTCSS